MELRAVLPILTGAIAQSFAQVVTSPCLFMEVGARPCTQYVFQVADSDKTNENCITTHQARDCKYRHGSLERRDKQKKKEWEVTVASDSFLKLALPPSFSLLL